MTRGSSGGSCIIVGAGMSGLLAARELRAAGWDVTVLDKGRGVGGRMATRRVGDGTCDHGAQFFTVRSERFERLVRDWLDTGVAEEWSRGFPDSSGGPREDGYPRYRGSEGMTFIPKHLARGLDVRTGERVLRTRIQNGSWEAVCESGLRLSAKALLLTAPAPQSLEILDAGEVELSEGTRQQLEDIAYDPCLALLATVDREGLVPDPGGIQIKGEPLDWISDNARKGISSIPALTIHAGPQWSRSHFSEDELYITNALLGFAGEQLGVELSPRVRETSLARWRYSWVTQPHPEPCLLAHEEPRLVFAGDAFGQPKVEGASLSGLAAADALLDRSS